MIQIPSRQKNNDCDEMLRADLSADAEMLASVEANRGWLIENSCCVGIGLCLFPNYLCLDTAADQHQQQTAADPLIGPNLIEHRLRQSREFPRFKTKAGIPA